MKTNRMILFLLGMGLLAMSCSEDPKDYYTTLGILKIFPDTTVIEADDGERLWVINQEKVPSDLKNNDRINLYFSMVKKTLPAGMDHAIDIYSVEKVLFKPVVVLTDENADSIGNDPLKVYSLWIARDYLNLSFLYYGGYQKHYINLIHSPEELPNDTVDLEIRHNSKEDTGLNYMNGFVSFDLKSLRMTETDSIVLRIKANEYENRTYLKTLSYRYK